MLDALNQSRWGLVEQCVYNLHHFSFGSALWISLAHNWLQENDVNWWSNKTEISGIQEKKPKVQKWIANLHVQQSNQKIYPLFGSFRHQMYGKRSSQPFPVLFLILEDFSCPLMCRRHCISRKLLPGTKKKKRKRNS